MQDPGASAGASPPRPGREGLASESRGATAWDPKIRSTAWFGELVPPRFFSVAVPVRARWEISHRAAIKLSHFNSGRSVVSSSFSIFVPRNSPEYYNANYQGSEVGNILNQTQILIFWTDFWYGSAWYTTVFTSLAFNTGSGFQLCFTSCNSCRECVWAYERLSLFFRNVKSALTMKTHQNF